MNQHEIFNIKSPAHFEQLALDAFAYQIKHNEVYARFCKLIKTDQNSVKSVKNIPFLPIQFFKSHEVISSKEKVETVFTSSGTTGSTTSKHYITDLKIYEKSFLESFRLHYGSIEEYSVLALLPSYLERNGSSLIYMVDRLITESKNENSGFYLNDLSALSEKLKKLDAAGKKVLLIGVSFALLDLVENFEFKLNHTVVMETGGMKGRRKELVREELHEILKSGFGVDHIHSEYGMTELLSQAYSTGDGIFTTPPWMRIIIRDTEDALQILPKNKTGGINVIDLANINSCPFIATQDLGKELDGNYFEVLGRFDTADIRGCNLMVL
ncbi:MAG: acyl transferase [Leeuwenhoekiella sp.]